MVALRDEPGEPALRPARRLRQRRHGALLAAVLAQTPDARGVLFAVPSGSFFDSVPDGGDAYPLKWIIHDWDDDSSLTILGNVRTAIARDGKFLSIEMVLPDGAPPHPGMMLDVEMLVHTGGRESTAAEYSNLLPQAGFRLNRVTPTARPAAVVDAVLVAP